MSNQPKKYLRCACSHCGQPIEFPAYAVGGLTLCPHCGKSTVTSAPSSPIATSPLLLPSPAGAAPALPHVTQAPTGRCPKCGQALAAGGRCGCGSTARAKPKATALIRAGLFFVVVALAVGASLALSRKTARPPDGAISTPPETTVTTDVRPAETVTVTNVPAAPKSVDDLRVSEVLIQRPKGARGSRLIYAVGSLTNTSMLQRLGVRLQLNLLNNKGEKIDETSDYQAFIRPGETWQFRAVVHDPLVVTGSVARIVEDN